MDREFYKSIKGDLLYSKTMWGVQRLNMAYYISLGLGGFNLFTEFTINGPCENLQHKLLLILIYGTFIILNKKINANASLVKYISFIFGELLNLVLIYYSYIKEPELSLLWIQISSFVVIFYQSYLLIGMKSILIFSIKHSAEWIIAGIYFSSINSNNFASFLSGVVAMPLFIFACTYFGYLQEIDICYSKRKAEIAMNKIDALVESISDSIFVLTIDLIAAFTSSSSKCLLKNKTISEYLTDLSYHMRYENQVNVENTITDDIKQAFTKPIGSRINFGVTKNEKQYIEWSGKVVIWENRISLILFGKDVTKLIQLKKESLENQYKSALLRTVSHELRTPTNAMLAMTQLIKESRGISEENSERLDLTVSSCTYLLCLINDLLDYSQIMAGSLKVSKISFDIVQLLSECLKLIEVQLIGSSIELKLNFLSDIPKILISDPYRIKQIVLNLLSNARKFTLKGVIALNVIYKENKLTISCDDTGIGIPQDKISMLFTEFGRINESNLNPQGVGLGLYISNMLTFELGGNGIHASSQIGEGSCFSFMIEVQEPAITLEIDDVPDEYPNIVFPVLEISDYVKKREILIVDDTYFNILAYMQILRAVGYKCSYANNGREAIDKIKRKVFLCILMDCEMPEINGWEATKLLNKMVADGRIKKLPPIIGCTSHSSEIIKYQCLEAGMNDYILKPCPKEILIKKIQDLTKE